MEKPMSVGLLIFLNFSTIPFIHEFVKHGELHEKLPKMHEVLRLKLCLLERWFYWYLVLLFLFFILWVSPSGSGSRHVASIYLIITVVVVQVLAWGFSIYRILNLKRAVENE
jgi:hypothetical protein